jgi:hypothetical protein
MQQFVSFYSKTTQPCTQETRIQNHKKLHAQNQRLMWTTTLQKEQKSLLDAPEDGQLGRNM